MDDGAEHLGTDPHGVGGGPRDPLDGLGSGPLPLRPEGEAVPAAEAALAEPPALDLDPAEPPPALSRPETGPEPADAPAPAPEPAEPLPLATVLATGLAAAGAKIAFTVPGESFLPLLSALPEAGVRVVSARHEGGAAFMAEAAAQLTGKPQLLLVTRAVGATNAAIGIHTARSDSAPLVTIVGDARSQHRGREGFQAIDLAGTMGALALHAAAPRSPEDAVSATTAGLRAITSGRPGPLLLAIPEDLFPRPVRRRVEAPRPGGGRGPDRDAVRAVLHLLAGSTDGAILAGGGVLRSRASRRLLELAEALGVPVIATWRRPDVVPNEHPHYLGVSGYWAAPTVLERLKRADALLVLGSRLSEPASFGWRIPDRRTRWAHVDLAPRRAHAGLPAPEIAIATDVARFLEVALALLRNGALDAGARQARLDALAADRAAWEAATAPDPTPWDGPGVHPGHAMAALARSAPPTTIVTTDAGNFAGWLVRGYRFSRPGSFVGPTSGAMGYALPAAIAASLLHPDRPVVALAGDGGFAMTMAELETSVRSGARPVVIVFDNGRYGTIRMHQDRAGLTPVGSELGPIDAAAIARACGALGFTAERDDEVEPVLRQAFAARRTAVVRLIVDPAWVSVDERP